MSNYTCYHLHSELSLLDSCTKYQLYVDRAKELGQSAICFTEHGNCYQWIEKKEYCEKNGIKYLHGIEIYLTQQLEPKVRDNYHTILIAKNYDGVKEINSLFSLSSEEDHLYYKHRISFDEFRKISSHVIKISACLASPLNKLRDESLIPFYDYLEIQPHINSEEQKEYNLWLYQMSKKYNKPLIAGTDTHSINSYKAECRSILQVAKKIEFSNEDEFDLTYKTYDELCDMFKQQGVLPEDVYLKAIENTNAMADSVSEFELDKSFKYAKCYDDDETELKRRCNERYNDKVRRGVIKPSQQYIDSVREELRVFKKIGMMGFMLFMSDLVTWCWENGIPIGPCRGSVGGSEIAYLIDIIDVDPVVWHTVFSRFANESRTELGDIDIDIAPDQRDLVYKHIIDTYGADYTGYILAIGTISDKGTIDEIGRALATKWEKTHQDKENNPYSLDRIAEIKAEYENDPDGAKKKHPDLFYYFDGLLNTAISQSVHPAGIIVSPITLPDNYGMFWSSDGKRILQIDMENCHEVNLNKYDLLALKNIEVIRDTCTLANVPYPKSYTINWRDDAVWDDMITSPAGVFQFEGDYAFKMLKAFRPHEINDMSKVNASLRPSGASYRDRLLAREFNHNPSKIIDDLLADTYGHLVYQEQVIAFLQQICGLSGSEADNIRRAIGRKQKDRLDAAMPSILEGYCSKSDKPREVAEEEAKKFLQIIEDASSYMFGFNHSTGYSMVGYMCAMLRYYYPYEFIAAYLNNASNEDDIRMGTDLAASKGIKILPPKFGHAKDVYFPDRDNGAIYKGIASIKYMSADVANKLYDLAHTQKFDSFIDLLRVFPGDSRQLEILIKLNYFSQFAPIGKLLNIVELYNKFGTRKTLKESDVSALPAPVQEVIAKYTVKPKTQYKITDSDGMLRDLAKLTGERPITMMMRLGWEKELLGYCSSTDPSQQGSWLVLDIDTKYSPKLSIYAIWSGEQRIVKVSKRDFQSNPLTKGDTIRLTIEQRPKTKLVDGQWVKDESVKEDWLKYYSIQRK